MKPTYVQVTISLPSKDFHLAAIRHAKADLGVGSLSAAIAQLLKESMDKYGDTRKRDAMEHKLDALLKVVQDLQSRS